MINCEVLLKKGEFLVKTLHKESIEMSKEINLYKSWLKNLYNSARNMINATTQLL